MRSSQKSTLNPENLKGSITHRDASHQGIRPCVRMIAVLPQDKLVGQGRKVKLQEFVQRNFQTLFADSFIYLPDASVPCAGHGFQGRLPFRRSGRKNRGSGDGPGGRKKRKCLARSREFAKMVVNVLWRAMHSLNSASWGRALPPDPFRVFVIARGFVRPEQAPGSRRNKPRNERHRLKERFGEIAENVVAKKFTVLP